MGSLVPGSKVYGIPKTSEYRGKSSPRFRCDEKTVLTEGWEGADVGYWVG